MFHNVWELERLDSSSINDLQGHSRALAMVPFERPHTISYYSSIATISLLCTVLEILLLISQNLKRSRSSEHIDFGGSIMHAPLYVSISTRNLKHPASPIPKIWLGKFFKRVTWLWPHPLGLVVCNLKTSTWYILPAIWRLSFQPFRRYNRGHRKWKLVMWSWQRPL